MLTNLQTGTKNDEVAEGTYRVNTPLMTDAIPGGFKLGQYLVLDRPPGSPASMAALIAARAERCFAKLARILEREQRRAIPAAIHSPSIHFALIERSMRRP